MIEQAKLNALPDEVIFKLKAQIDATAVIRKRSLLIPGNQATFTNSRTGNTVRLMIEGRGPKNISGYIIHPDGRHDLRSKWRVHPEFLTPYFPPKKPAPAPLGSGTDAPATASTGW